MDYLKRLKFPLLMSALIFGLSVLVFLKIDFYAVVLSVSYLVLGSISAVGSRYFDLIKQQKASKSLFKMFADPPAVFLLILGFFYAVTGDLHWIFIGTALFIAFVTFVIAFSDWMQAKENIK